MDLIFILVCVLSVVTLIKFFLEIIEYFENKRKLKEFLLMIEGIKKNSKPGDDKKIEIVLLKALNDLDLLK